MLTPCWTNPLKSYPARNLKKPAGKIICLFPPSLITCTRWIFINYPPTSPFPAIPAEIYKCQMNTCPWNIIGNDFLFPLPARGESMNIQYEMHARWWRVHQVKSQGREENTDFYYYDQITWGTPRGWWYSDIGPFLGWYGDIGREVLVIWWYWTEEWYVIWPFSFCDIMIFVWKKMI